jgi:hypothetical protein
MSNKKRAGQQIGLFLLPGSRVPGPLLYRIEIPAWLCPDILP